MSRHSPVNNNDHGSNINVSKFLTPTPIPGNQEWDKTDSEQKPVTVNLPQRQFHCCPSSSTINTGSGSGTGGGGGSGYNTEATTTTNSTERASSVVRRRQRRRQKFKSKCLGPTLMTLHILFSAGIFLSIECEDYLKGKVDATLAIAVVPILLASITMSLLFASICMDPGIFPKPSPVGQEIEAQYYNQERLKSDFNLETGVTKKIMLYGKEIHGNYCFECRHFKDARTRHCRICKKCVVRHDHHCTVLGCCVGIRNFAIFYYLQVFLLLYYIFIWIHSIVILIWHLHTKSVKMAILGSPSLWTITLTVLSVIIFGLGHVLLFPFTYCYLMGHDRTSRELFFVVETKGVKCHCERIEKVPMKEEVNKLSTQRIFTDYLCICPPPSLLNGQSAR